MSLQLNKHAIIKNTVKVGGFTFLSRILGIIREVLLVRFFGVGALSDAFIMAFRIPNFFRHIFAEGAMSAAFIPVFVKSVKEKNTAESNGLMSLSFLFFEGLVLILYALILFNTPFVVRCIAPGFSEVQVAYTVPFLRILFPFLLFVSSSSLLAGALQSVNHFFAPAFGTPLWNLIYIITLLIALTNNLSSFVICFGILIGGAAQFLLHLYFFFKSGFSFGSITQPIIASFKTILAKFFPCLFGVSIVELNLLVSGIVASFLPKGSVSLLYYGSRFMNIPLGVFAVALSSVLLPHFSRVVLYAPKRLNFYILETAKSVTWIVLPFVLAMTFFAKPLFAMILSSKHGGTEHVHQACIILSLYLVGLLFFCLNKILLNVFYAMKDTWSTTKSSAISAFVNIAGDIVGMLIWGTYGIAGACAFSGIIMTFSCFYYLKKKHGFRFYSGNYFNFLGRYCTQLTVVSAGFLILFYTAQHYALTIPYLQWILTGIGFWFFAGILTFCSVLFIFVTRSLFGINLYFLKK
ncbi:MAG: Integral membrane protein MviN [candidate division TM6 bacterium GW2011_GWF2_38_10]|nr:MAG: Integral membrane protein MviN [candidate division TM6 bacterium GW2011_GWF2_38_10]